MPAPYEYDYENPLDLPEAKEDLEFINGIAKDTIGSDTAAVALGSIGDGEVQFVPSGDGGYCVTVSPLMFRPESEWAEDDPDISSRTLVFDGLMRVKRAVVEAGTDLPGENGMRYTKRIPKAAAAAFVASIATSIRDEL